MTSVDRVEPELGSIALALWAQGEGRKAAAELSAAGVPVLLLKGPDLQTRLYGTPAAYVSGDVDVLVPRNGAVIARRALIGRGWVFSVDNGVLWRLSRAASFDRDGFRLDLHWGLHAGHLASRSLAPLERRLWSGAGLGASGMYEPDIESLLVFLAVHAAGHRFERAHWGENVHRAAAQVSDWPEVWRIARSARVEGAVRAALDGVASPRYLQLLDGVRGYAISTTTWVGRGHFIPQATRASVRRYVASVRDFMADRRRARRL